MTSSPTKSTGNELKSDAKQAVKDARHDIRDTIENISGDVTYLANKAGREIRGYIDTAGDEFTRATDVVTDEIRTNPLRSILVALGAGFVLGAFLRK